MSVPTLPKPPKWGLSSEKQAGLGLEPSAVDEVGGESRSDDEGSSISTARNQVRRGRHHGLDCMLTISTLMVAG